MTWADVWKLVLLPLAWYHRWRLNVNHQKIEFFQRCKKESISPKSIIFGDNIYSDDHWSSNKIRHEMWLERYDRG